MALKLVLFDLDGTLLDTLSDLTDATNAALSGFSLPPLPREMYKLLVGNGARVLMRRAVAEASRLAGMAERIGYPADDELVAAFNREYDQRWHNRTQPYPGIPALLDALRDAGLLLGILSNKPDAFTGRIVRHFFPDEAFSIVTGMRPDKPGKPDPGLALDLCRQTGVDPEDAAMVGDSSTDILTAVAAGMEPIGVLWGFRSAEELIGAGARHLVRSADELGALLRVLQAPQASGHL